MLKEWVTNLKADDDDADVVGFLWADIHGDA